jgi:hypothetical protein
MLLPSQCGCGRRSGGWRHPPLRLFFPSPLRRLVRAPRLMGSGEKRAVLRPVAAAWERSPVRQTGKDEIRKRRAMRALLALVEARFGTEVSRVATAAAAAASLERVQRWALRAHYQPSWEAVLDGRPLVGVRVVSFQDLVAAAIGNPLETWCLRAYYASRGDDLEDTERIQWAALWLRENFHLVGGLQADLRYHRAALLSCETEGLARGLQATVKSKWLTFTLYKPDGFVTH